MVTKISSLEVRRIKYEVTHLRNLHDQRFSYSILTTCKTRVSTDTTDIRLALLVCLSLQKSNH